MKAFAKLAEVVKEMESCAIDVLAGKPDDAADEKYDEAKIAHILECLDNCYKYHKSNFVFNIARHSEVRSHCISFLCSDSDDKKRCFQSECEEGCHQKSCPNCDMVSELCMVIMAMKEKIKRNLITTDNTSKLNVAKWTYDINESEKAIHGWRNFMIRNKISNQEWSKQLTTDNPKSATAIFDYAMKFPPMSHIESQPMWFAKSGIVWHLGCYQWLVGEEMTSDWYTDTDVHTSILG